MTMAPSGQPIARGTIRKPPRIDHRVRLADARDLSRLQEIAAEAGTGIGTGTGSDLAALQQEENLFVAEWRTALDGFIVLLPLHDAILVHRLAVATEMRRRGLGGWLLDFAAQHARAAGLAGVEIQLPEQARDQAAWLQRRGFVPLAPSGNRILLRRPATP
jgi:GNAT superfamily N-acetyltransferase